jgi:hypothetical protein
MELSTNQKLELKEIKKLLEEEYPEFQMDIKNGPFFEFLVIKKSSFNGVVVRIKGDKILTYKSAPTLIGRIFPFISIISMAGDNFIEGVDWVLEKKYSN